MQAYDSADYAWRMRCEQETNGYRAEMVAFKRSNPRPTLRAFMIAYRTR
jgi:hypothetical protein